MHIRDGERIHAPFWGNQFQALEATVVTAGRVTDRTAAKEFGCRGQRRKHRIICQLPYRLAAERYLHVAGGRSNRDVDVGARIDHLEGCPLVNAGKYPAAHPMRIKDELVWRMGM